MSADQMPLCGPYHALFLASLEEMMAYTPKGSMDYREAEALLTIAKGGSCAPLMQVMTDKQHLMEVERTTKERMNDAMNVLYRLS